MRRSPRLAVAALLATVAVVAALCAGALARSGWGPALQSVLDRVLHPVRADVGQRARAGLL